MDQDKCSSMAVNIDTFISNKCPFFGEVALAIYLIRRNTTHLVADGHKQDVPWKATLNANCDTECFGVLQMLPWAHKSYKSLDFQGISDPSNTRQSNHNNTPLRGQTGFVAIIMSFVDFSFQMILWKHH